MLETLFDTQKNYLKKSLIIKVAVLKNVILICIHNEFCQTVWAQRKMSCTYANGMR